MDTTLRSILALLLLFLFTATACDRGAEAEPPQPWTYASDAAPYALTLSGHWRAEQADLLNAHADFAASIEDTLFLIVLPQELPAFPTPDAAELQEASLEMMRETLDEVSVQRQGPVEIDDRKGKAVFFRGIIEEQPIQYIATYLTDETWGYQIIAWGPAPRERQLIGAVDKALKGWKFRSIPPSDETEPAAPAPSAEAADPGTEYQR